MENRVSRESYDMLHWLGVFIADAAEEDLLIILVQNARKHLTNLPERFSITFKKKHRKRMYGSEIRLWQLDNWLDFNSLSACQGLFYA